MRQTLQAYTLVLVDDGCTDDTVARVRSRMTSGRLIILSGNGQLWWAGALELAYRQLAPELTDRDAVLIINDDVTFADDFLSNGMDALRRHPGACLQAIGVDQHSRTTDRGAVANLVRLTFRGAEEGEQPNCLSTRGLLMDADTFRHSNGFRPRWLPHYLSDYEFTLRIARRGTQLQTDPDFWATMDLTLTGMDRPSMESARTFWRDSFSNRAKFNPCHWTAFVLLVCPTWVVPLHVARIWARFGKSLLAAALRSRPRGA